MKNALALTLLLPLSVAGCSTNRADDSSVGLANPASEHCLQIGGRLEIVDGGQGQIGLCHLPDGSTLEEWALFRRDHGRQWRSGKVMDSPQAQEKTRRD